MNLTASEAERIHEEHHILFEELRQLDRGLDHLTCFSEVYADLAGAEDVRFFGRKLLQQLADHFRREEITIFAPASQVSAEISDFCFEMRNEHGALLVRAAAFEKALEELEHGSDLYDAVCNLKIEGKQLTEGLRRHMAKEESELNGFL